ncbi:hypothetical protein B0I35DRAFT_425369 [Stachybotrys elegans]|uniref:C2H2-type domain-containing protein n=1 Tax=Stachybotrys elegans TaxID=80388 RepID=A0A8K0SZX6_9HYPO|nr:hypothetical protein B0I35DRAFT_425369 [Stachybotrys elegans]
MPAPAVSASARHTISCAFKELEKTITPGDSRNFPSVTLHQVKLDVLKIEDELAARQSLRNMRRLAPLFQGLEHYAKVMDVLCNGTPFLSWAWAPVSLILRISSEHLEAFELIIKGYSRIAECLGRFSTLGNSFRSNKDFQQTLAVFYADILEFHKHAYQFVRRSSWKLFFITSWHRFQRRFDQIFENLQRHGELIDKEANAYNIAEAKQMRQEIRAWREECEEKFARAEKEQNKKQHDAIASWLKADESDQLKIFHTLLEEATKYPGTCDWVLRNRKMALALQSKPDIPLLRVEGAVGTGKSILASSIVNFAASAGSLILSHFCNYAYPSSTRYDFILRSLLLQLVRSDEQLASHVYESYVLGKKSPGLPVLESLLKLLLSSVSRAPQKASYAWVIIDGLHECEPLVQSKIFSLLGQVTSISSNSETSCKALLFCRFSNSATPKLRKSPLILLAEEKKYTSESIRRYSARRLESIYNRFEQMSLTMSDIKEIEDAITQKADGMFLYARLVLDYLSSNIFFSGEEIKRSVYELPASLSEFYSKIMTQILVRLDSRSVDRVKCTLGWIAFSKRPLRKTELLSAIAFSSGDPSVKNPAPQFLLDICATLIEERSDARLGFIHASVKEFLQSSSSNLVLVERDCLLQHGIATIACLLAGIEAFTNESPDHSVLLCVIKGLHSFHIYAKEFWTDYLLSLSPLDTESGSTASPLFALAQQLAVKLDQLSQRLIETPEPVYNFHFEDQAQTKLEDERIVALRSVLLKVIINRCLKARSFEQLEAELQQIEVRGQSVDHFATSPIPSPQEGVSLVLQGYQASIRYLLDQSDHPGVTAAEFESFKHQSRDTAYTCRIKGCIRASDGFEHQVQFYEHEILHVRRLKCTYSGCQYPPFVSSRALKTHIMRTHKTTTQRRSIRKIGTSSMPGIQENSVPDPDYQEQLRRLQAQNHPQSVRRQLEMDRQEDQPIYSWEEANLLWGGSVQQQYDQQKQQQQQLEQVQKNARQIFRRMLTPYSEKYGSEENVPPEIVKQLKTNSEQTAQKMVENSIQQRHQQQQKPEHEVLDPLHAAAWTGGDMMW